MQAHNRRNDMRPGAKFGHWTVLYEAGQRYACSARFVRCVCQCGRERDVHVGNLRAGQTKSCGCLTQRTKHAMSGTPEHQIWRHIKNRCFNPRNRSFADYGGRGITVCSEWRNSFEVFIAHVGRRPSPELTLDRINNDGNYEPGNVRWATRKQQTANTRMTTERRRELGRLNAAKRWGRNRH